jgi:flagellin
MTSLVTNSSAMTALQSLTQTMKNMETTQSRISTGLRVNTAADNAAYWSIATTMRSDKAALSTVTDALNLGSSTIDVAYTGIKSAIDVTSQIKSKLVAAAQPGVDRTKVQSEVTQLQQQLKSISDSAVFSGQNWVSVDSGAASYNSTKSIVSSFQHDGAGVVSVGNISIDASGFALFDTATNGPGPAGLLDKADTVTIGRYTNAAGVTTTTAPGGTGASVYNLNISTLTDSAADLATLNAYTQQVDKSIAGMTSAASNLGSVKSRVTLQQSFVSSLMASIDKGIGSLVDADMNEESTRLQALQVQQQLGVQALSIANQSTQTILSLFRG